MLRWPGRGQLPLGCPTELFVLGSSSQEGSADLVLDVVGLSCSGEGLERGASRNGSLRAAGRAEGAERQGAGAARAVGKSVAP